MIQLLGFLQCFLYFWLFVPLLIHIQCVQHGLGTLALILKLLDVVSQQLKIQLPFILVGELIFLGFRLIEDLKDSLFFSFLEQTQVCWVI